MGFAGTILIGALLLMLPFATKDGRGAEFIDALFTATSATCVTGLVVFDTFTYWSVFGQVIILLLIQVGGMGVVTMAITIFIVTGRKIWSKSTLFDAGIYFCTSDGRNRQADRIYHQIDDSDGRRGSNFAGY